MHFPRSCLLALAACTELFVGAGARVPLSSADINVSERACLIRDCHASSAVLQPRSLGRVVSGRLKRGGGFFAPVPKIAPKPAGKPGGEGSSSGDAAGAGGEGRKPSPGSSSSGAESSEAQFEGELLTSEQYYNGGMTRFRSLEDIVRNPASTDRIAMDLFNSDGKYTVRAGSGTLGSTDGTDLGVPFTQIKYGDGEPHLTTSASYRDYSITNPGKGQIIVLASYSKDERAIVVDYSSAANDINTDRLFWSEIVFQSWRSVATDEATASLNFVVRRHINNAGTQTTIDLAHSAAHIPPGEPGVWGKSDPAFYQLLGTDNGKGVVRMLEDHPNALGRKQVDRIYTWRDEAGRKYPMMILHLAPS